jgi:hypothetical protein
MSTIQANAENRKMAVATALAQDIAEFLKFEAFDSANLSIGPHTDPNNPVNADGGSTQRKVSHLRNEK